eukprot:12905519-Prorocentrum_lima.AAC.1
MGRVFAILVEKNSELAKDNPPRTFKSRVVFQGNNVATKIGKLLCSASSRVVHQRWLPVRLRIRLRFFPVMTYNKLMPRRLIPKAD